MKKIIFLVVLMVFSFQLYSQPAPSRDSEGEATFTDDGIWHKNMELICPINIPDPHHSEMIEFIQIDDKYCFVGSFQNGANDFNRYIRVDDLTNPRSPLPNILRIYITAPDEDDETPDDDYDDNNFVELGQCQVWDSGTNVYAICSIQDTVDVNNERIKAIIINLTEAIEWSQTNSFDEIVISSLQDRSSTFEKGNETNTNSDIYIGYIDAFEEYFYQANCDSTRKELYKGIHTLTVDRMSSVLTFSHLCNSVYTESSVLKTDAFVDVFVLDGDAPGSFYGIEDHPNYNHATDLVKPSRLMNDGKPIRITLDGEQNQNDMDPDYRDFPDGWPEVTAIHETHAHKIKKVVEGVATNETYDHRISLSLACPGSVYPNNSFYSCNKTPTDLYNAEGGFAIVDIDYSVDPTNSNVTFEQWINGDPDRLNPDKRTSPETFGGGDSWSNNIAHSIEGIHIDLKNHFFATTQELAGPFLVLKDDDTPAEIGFGVNVGGAYIGLRNGIQPLNENDSFYDDRRIGNFLRIWGGDKGHRLIRGLGSESDDSWNNGDAVQVSSYDVLEQSTTDRASGNFFPVQHNDEIDTIVCHESLDKGRAPNSIHHLRTHFGSTGMLPELSNDFRLRSEIYIGAYAGGARVVDIKNFLREDDISNNITYSKKTILERAYFDMIPTLNFDYTDRYFYMQASREDDANGNYKFQPDDIRIVNYYSGLNDIFPDSRRTNYNHDEDFVYATGLSGKQGPFLEKGGYLILRYFRDEIGGIISGNNPSTEVLYNDMKFRKVNLQGEFKVQRDVTIAAGAEVWLLPGEEGSERTLDKMEFTVGDNGEMTVYVDGTLHVSLEDGNNGGSNIGVGVPVVVRDGGKLFIHNIRDGKDRVAEMKKKISVLNGGLLEITENAKVMINDLFVDDGGQFIVKEGAEITFDTLWHINYGVAKFMGTVSNPITVSADIEFEDIIGLDFSEMNNYVQLYFFGGTNLDMDEDEVFIEHTTFKGVHINCYNKNITKVENNKFYDNSDDVYAYPINASIPVFFFPQFEANINYYGLSNLPDINLLNINNNIFKDFSISHMDSTKYVDGLSVSGNYKLTVEDNTFENLRLGANVILAQTCTIYNNTFDDMIDGLNVKSTMGKICNNEFENNMNSITYDKTNVFQVFDNDMTVVGVGMNSMDSEYQMYRNNEFTNYFRAICEYNSIALLRGLYNSNTSLSCPLLEPLTLLGRNKFNNGIALLFTNPYLQTQNDPKRSDIYLVHKEADVYMNCGYNDLSKYSPEHIYYDKLSTFDPNKSVDGSNNKWNNTSPSIQPRTENVTVTGTPLDQSQTTTNSCEIKDGCSCLISGIYTPNDCLDNFSFEKVNFGNWIEITYTDTAATFFDDIYYFYYNNIEDVTLSEPCRPKFAASLLGSAVLGDSSTVKVTQVNSLLRSMFIDTVYSVYERINLGYVLAEGYERVGELDSALDVLVAIKPLDYQPYNSRADWDIARLKSKQFTDLDSVSFYFKDYQDKFLERIELRFDSTGAALKSARENNLEYTSDNNELFENKPNPFSDNTEISYYLSDQDEIKVSVINETGKEVFVAFEGIQSKGTHIQELNLENLDSGVYFYILKTSRGSLMKKMYIIK